ncbi:MAG: hypothetical protein KW802_03555 [Candidatus Doudnabacteria bacterium]|nr:hypothetical protein [Candidatus Doudnabacteria bacterium]
MYNLKLFIKNHQQQVVLVIGYLFVAALAFGLGRHSTPAKSTKSNATTLPVNYSSNPASAQTTAAAASTENSTVNCDGKIKGSKSMIYHLPGGAFYTKTTSPIRCFDTEAQAAAAGFRKSSR